MRLPRLEATILGVLLVGAALCSWMAYSAADRLSGDLQRILAMVGAEQNSTLQTTWKDADNLIHAVTTTRREGETAAAFAVRHKEEVDALKALYPPA